MVLLANVQRYFNSSFYHSEGLEQGSIGDFRTVTARRDRESDPAEIELFSISRHR